MEARHKCRCNSRLLQTMVEAASSHSTRAHTARCKAHQLALVVSRLVPRLPTTCPLVCLNRAPTWRAVMARWQAMAVFRLRQVSTAAPSRLSIKAMPVLRQELAPTPMVHTGHLVATATMEQQIPSLSCLLAWGNWASTRAIVAATVPVRANHRSNHVYAHENYLTA